MFFGCPQIRQIYCRRAGAFQYHWLYQSCCICSCRMGDWPPWFPSTNDRMALTIFSEVDNTYADIVTTTPTTRASTITTRTPGQCVSSPIPFLESSQQLCLIFRWPVPPVTSVDNILVALRIHQQLLFLSTLLKPCYCCVVAHSCYITPKEWL